MGKVIAAINITIDGVCDHTAVNPDAEIHQHYTDLINSGYVILYGRKTYQLMQFWQPFLKNPSDEKSMNDFAVAIDKTPKIVFSHTLKEMEWDSAQLANKPIEEVIQELKPQSGKPILIGSRSLIMQLIRLNLVDELQLCVHPVVAGGGMLLFEDVMDRKEFKLTHTKSFRSGAIILYYEQVKEKR